MSAILSVQKKHFSLHMELVHRLKGSANEDLWRSVIVHIGTFDDCIPETGIRSGHRVAQGKEQLTVYTIENEGRALSRVRPDVLVRCADQEVRHAIFIEIPT